MSTVHTYIQNHRWAARLPLYLSIGLLFLTVAAIISAETLAANAGADLISGPGDVVVLDGTASTGDGLTFAWTQTGGTVVVTLDDAHTATPSFVFPVTADPLTFELTVTDVNGDSDTDTVVVTPEVLGPPPSLKTVPVPEPANLMDYVKDREAAIQLGKALFWDMQVGSDGRQACATCHYNSGVDNRVTNRLHPGGDQTFQANSANGTLTLADFPFHALANPDDRDSAVLFDTDDVVGGRGVTKMNFDGIVLGSAIDAGTAVTDPIFTENGQNLHQVTGRDTPTVINAIFNVRSFWDGRANFVFNGVNPFGQRDPNARILEVQPDGSVIPVAMRLEMSSLASQAVGPPNSDVEMAWNGRTFPDIGRKLLNLTPLAQQTVAPDDSVLGSLAITGSGVGLSKSYEEMIQAAFHKAYWDANVTVTFDSSGAPTVTPAAGAMSANEYSLMEANFSLFFGLAVQLYESTLVSDDAPYDRFQEGDASALTAQQQRGLDLFIGPAGCVACHNGAEFTAATVSHIITTSDPGQEEEIIERMVMGDGGVAIYDNAFYNIGVRPNSDDVGLGGTDPFGNPLSFTRLVQQGVPVGAPFSGVNPPVNPAERTAVDGAFKTPTLRNIELTAPYMHNGGLATLEQVIDFYNRGSDFHDENFADLAPNIGNLGLSQQDKQDLVAFLLSLTDERVRFQQAPFDHPQLFLPNGNGELLEVPATGAGGGPALQPFVDIHPGVDVEFAADQTIVLPDEPVQFTVTVQNTGDSNLDKPVLITSLGCAWAAPDNDLWAANVLEIGEAWTYACTQNVSQDITNVASFQVEDKVNNGLNYLGHASVNVIHPDISVTLLAGATAVSSGDDVNFTVNVTNSGDVALANVAVNAPALPGCEATIMVLPALDSQTFTCTASNVTAAFTAVVNVSGAGILGNTWSDSAQQTIQLSDGATTGGLLYLSLARRAVINGASYRDEDILSFDGANLALVFDGSDVGVGGVNLDAFHFVDATHILMSFHRPLQIGSLGMVDDSDVVLFSATSLGENTAGTFSLYFDGSAAGLTEAGEDVDAVTLLDDGRLLISTTGSNTAGFINGKDEDVLAFTPAAPDDYLNGGQWAMYFDGSTVGLNAGREDVTGTAVSPNELYLTTQGSFTVTGLSGNGADIFTCAPSGTGCASFSLFFDGRSWGLSGASIDAFALEN